MEVKKAEPKRMGINNHFNNNNNNGYERGPFMQPPMSISPFFFPPPYRNYRPENESYFAYGNPFGGMNYGRGFAPMHGYGLPVPYDQNPFSHRSNRQDRHFHPYSR